MGVALFESTSILPIFTLPWYSVASSSTMGAIARQGPHHVAQKSTRTGLSDFKTSWSKFASVTSTIPLPAICFLLVVNVALSADAPARCVAGPGDLLVLPVREPNHLSYHCNWMLGQAGRSQRDCRRPGESQMGLVGLRPTRRKPI